MQNLEVHCSTISGHIPSHMKVTGTRFPVFPEIQRIEFDGYDWIVPTYKNITGCSIKVRRIGDVDEENCPKGSVRSGTLEWTDRDARSLVEEHVTPGNSTHALVVIDRVSAIKDITPNGLSVLASVKHSDDALSFVATVRPGARFSVIKGDVSSNFRCDQGKIVPHEPEESRRSTKNSDPEGGGDNNGGIRVPVSGPPSPTLFATENIPRDASS